MKEKQNGITLIALVVTIIILLILAGIAISQLTGENGLFNYAKRAKNNTLEAQELENTILGDYENKINEITGNAGSEEPKDVTLASKVQVGDYVKYEVDTASTATINSLLTELGTYSGSTGNTSTTLTQETDLTWRILDVIEENGKKKVRLISELPTKSTVTLNGYNGYNNAVYLLDKICSTLYNKTGYTEKVQNLKIEDITKFLKNAPSFYEATYSPESKYYPTILEQEYRQNVDGKTGTLGISEQNAPINQTEPNQATSWTLTANYNNGGYKKSEDFINDIYYKFFINDGTNNYDYWLSSRIVTNAVGKRLDFGVRTVGGFYKGSLNGNTMITTENMNWEDDFLSLRPVATLQSEVYITGGNGTKENPYTIKTDIVIPPDATETGAITFSNPTWSNGQAQVTISTNTSYKIEYQANGTSGTWTQASSNGTSITAENLNHNDVVYARLTDGVNATNKSTLTIVDAVAPSNATITLSSTSANVSEEITATVTHTDSESGVDITKCKWV